MSEHEKLRDKAETGHEQLDLQETSKHNLERIKNEAENVEHDHSIDKIHESIHKEAVSGKEVTIGEHAEDNSQPVFGFQRELKADAYQRTIQKVRSKLNPAERSLSTIVHNKFVEPVTELSSKSIARPSGILGSGIVALFGSGVVLYMAKRYGFEYNFSMFLILLAGGFFAGITLELLTKLLTRNRT